MYRDFLPKKILISSILCFCLFACNTKKQAKEDTNQSNIDQTDIRYARFFKALSKSDYKIVTVFRNNKNLHDSIQYILVNRKDALPKGFTEKQVIRVPIQKIILLSHTFIACVQALQMDASIVGVSETAYLPDSAILVQIKAKKIQDVGLSMGLNQELIVALKPDILMSNQVGEGNSFQNLEKLGIKVIINSDWLENTPLGRAEWLKFVALFYGKEDEATKQFNAIEKQYLAIRKKAENSPTKPKVLTDTPYKDTWYVPAGESFVARLLEDAGVDYIWKNEKGTASLPLSFETVYAKGLNADFWINLGLANSKQDLMGQDKRFIDFLAFKKGKLYNYNLKSNPNGGNQYLMRGIITPHLILADLVKIFHPELMKNHSFHYYQPIE